MKKVYIGLSWSIVIALVGALGFFATLWINLEIGGAYYLEYACAYIFSVCVCAYGGLNVFVHLYNDYIEDNEKDF